jgi:hypothetical protein
MKDILCFLVGVFVGMLTFQIFDLDPFLISELWPAIPALFFAGYVWFVYTKVNEDQIIEDCD